MPHQRRHYARLIGRHAQEAGSIGFTQEGVDPEFIGELAGDLQAVPPTRDEVVAGLDEVAHRGQAPSNYLDFAQFLVDCGIY